MEIKGIKRIEIVSDEQKYNALCNKVAPAIPDINSYYHKLLPLKEGSEVERVSRDSVLGRYDWNEGIDVILTLMDGSRITLQEKCIFQNFDTVTFEEKKGYGKQGAWYYCTAQLYFCCKINNDMVTNYVLIDLVRLKILSNQGKIFWYYRKGLTGDCNEFRYIWMQDVPQECILARHFHY